MCGMADMMGCTYEYVNVVLFCYVEPLLTVLMLFGAAYLLLGLPGVRCVGKGFMWFGRYGQHHGDDNKAGPRSTGA